MQTFTHNARLRWILETVFTSSSSSVEQLCHPKLIPSTSVDNFDLNSFLSKIIFHSTSSIGSIASSLDPMIDTLLKFLWRWNFLRKVSAWSWLYWTHIQWQYVLDYLRYDISLPVTTACNISKWVFSQWQEILMSNTFEGSHTKTYYLECKT